MAIVATASSFHEQSRYCSHDSTCPETIHTHIIQMPRVLLEIDRCHDFHCNKNKKSSNDKARMAGSLDLVAGIRVKVQSIVFVL